MPRVKRTKKEREAFLIREFLRNAGYEVSRLKCAERPDVFVTVERRGQTKRIGIEQTDYFNDTVAGAPSPITPIVGFWDLVQESLMRRISHRKRLTGLLAHVWFFKNPVLPVQRAACRARAKELAAELVQFTERHPIALGETRKWGRRDFDQLSVMKSLLESFRLMRRCAPNEYAFRSDWVCSNITTGGTTLSVDYIESAMVRKNSKALGYSRSGATELWLLISAGGDTVSNCGLPFRECRILDDVRLTNCCSGSPFDRIVFWERIAGWYKWLKPNQPAVSYRSL